MPARISTDVVFMLECGANCRNQRRKGNPKITTPPPALNHTHPPKLGSEESTLQVNKSSQDGAPNPVSALCSRFAHCRSRPSGNRSRGQAQTVAHLQPDLCQKRGWNFDVTPRT